MGRRMADRECVDLDISLYGGVGDSYGLDMQWTQPGGALAAGLRTPAEVHIDRARLQAAQIDIPAYGKVLWNSLFESRSALEVFVQARAAAVQTGMDLRVRLHTSPQAR